MSKNRQTHSVALATIAEDIQTLVAATTDGIGEKIDAARKRLSTALENGEEIYDQARKTAVHSVRKADKFVRENPYQGLAIAFGAGVLVTTWFLSRNRRD